MDGNPAESSEFSFEGESSSSAKQFVPDTLPPKLVVWVMKTGWVKTREQANWVLLGVAILAALVAVVVFVVSTRASQGHDKLDPIVHPGIIPR